MNYKLKELRKTTERIIRQAYEEPNEINGAVNWAHLHCTSAERIEDDSGDVYYRVIIEEASPGGNDNLRQFVAEKLEEAGYYADVITEW